MERVAINRYLQIIVQAEQIRQERQRARVAFEEKRFLELTLAIRDPLQRRRVTRNKGRTQPFGMPKP